VEIMSASQAVPASNGPVVYLVRHCQASGQAPDAPLTDLGHEQAVQLAETLVGLNIQRIVSSPYARACQTIAPLAERLGLPVETDARLVERVLAAEALSDWPERIRASFDDLELALPGGESTAAAAQRARQALDTIVSQRRLPAVVVAHGNLLAALLNHLDGRPGFETWGSLTNPDVFAVTPLERGQHAGSSSVSGPPEGTPHRRCVGQASAQAAERLTAGSAAPDSAASLSPVF
jgi:2,3-bisphosphoglycerate-dependent phosphoglycerate mutase